ncbi:MAG: proton-conducting transporter membrane subunit [Bacteroidales bacterium]|jgi:formate hydrogenlyase subunit 3/multisubunit Na+/H+ antiporter MnhD subunit|nr:proton-conducting transporter membrane subunit [Bacteroidales bacterium]
MIYLLVLLFITVPAVLLPGRRLSLIITAFLITIVAGVSSLLAISQFAGIGSGISGLSSLIQDNLGPLIVCDRLSAFFILIINFTVISGFIYSTEYLKPAVGSKPGLWVKIHFLALVWLHISMVMVPLLRDGFWFLVVWELMTLSSFVLVIFDYEKPGTLKAGINYLIQMHVGMIIIMSALFISSSESEVVSFDNLRSYFSEGHNWPVYALFFIGFGFKAGFIVLHTWLPEAHPAAPSHVSGIMSGVMIKLGIYGILRVTTFLQNDLFIVGALVIVISASTGIMGVMMAILQHDVKKLLAYHSIENIGIIGLGIGLGIFGTATGNMAVAAAGYAGALLHTLNHSLFKSLLFYSSGSVIRRIKVRNIERMGGLMKTIPLTAWAFLIGAIAISGLPPFNGFISEFLIYLSVFRGMGTPDFYPLLIFVVAMVSLVMIGGLALLCFTKVFSVMFLGQPREPELMVTGSERDTMLLAQLLPVIPVVVIGIAPMVVVPWIFNVTFSAFPTTSLFPAATIYGPFRLISVILLSFILTCIVIWLLRRLFVRRELITTGPTWGCGYTAVDQRQQYTATSFTQEYAQLANPVIKTTSQDVSFGEDEIFPGPSEFTTHSEDFIQSKIIDKPAGFLIRLLSKAAVFQTGRLQHYILHALIFLVVIFLLTFLKLI